MSTAPEGNTDPLEHAREHLYKPMEDIHPHPLLSDPEKRELPHTWTKEGLLRYVRPQGGKHVRFAGIFFAAALLFFLVSISVAGYVFFVGGNSVSVDKITVDVLGPTTIAGGDVVPLSLTITNKNAVAIENAVIEIDFPDGTRNADDVMQAYPRYIENLGTLESGASVTRSLKATVFGGAGQALSLPVALFYETPGSNATFVKESSYTLTVSTTPLSVAVDALTETVSGQPFKLTLTVSSNAAIPLENVMLVGAFPFGFTVTSSSLPLNNSSFLIGALAPGKRSTVTLTGTLTGQDNEQRVFHFTVGTAKTARDQELAISYMTQDAIVTLAAPFISTTLALNGDTSPTVVVAPDSQQNATLSYTNTLPTSVMDATVSVAISGTAVDYDSIHTTNGFYNSANHTVIFSKDTDSALALLSPEASGIGTFSFRTLPVNAFISAPTITFTLSVSGTRVGQTNVPGKISASATKTAKVATAVMLSASSLYASGPLSNSGPIPPRADQATTYTVVWRVQNNGNAVAGGIVSTLLPSYVSYTGLTAGSGSFSYNDASRVVSWNTGDLAQGAIVQGAFQVSLLPSTSQRGSAPSLTRGISFSGYDRFAGVQVSAAAEAVTTETKGEPGYSTLNAVVE
ncbi:hypothetical protein HY415_00795 [Candidatus Kaiserbacteria bacterium]|nr:hypothetical protein [Candidatus Kaiserbacteria bacterium]